MGPIKDNLNDTSGVVLSGDNASDRQMLALDALSNLARQFSQNPEFNNIIEVFVLTILGQFSVANAFVLFTQQHVAGTDINYYATGAFRNNEMLSSLNLEKEHAAYFTENRFPKYIDDLELPGKLGNLKFILSECSVKLLVPLIHNNNLFGLVGLGAKVNKLPYDESDKEILFTIINTVTPFVANTFLFLEMTEMSKWYLDILNSVRQGVFVFDEHGSLKKINDAGFRILKQFKPSLASIDALYKVPLELIFPNSIFHNWIRLFGPKSKYSHERLYENLRAKSGNIDRLYNVRLSRIKDKALNETDLIITLDDITDQKESEQRLFNLEKLADKGVMVASITHELNNFLGMMMTGVEMAQYSLNKGKTEKASYTLEKVFTTVGQMQRFTAGLTDYTRVETSKTNSNLNKIITDVLSFVSAQNKFRGINIVTELDQEIPELEFDIDQIAQVLMNFMNNAADSINMAKQTAGKIQVSTCAKPEGVELVIEDNGTGIEPELKDRLFRDHFTTKPEGHGYGLVTCARIIKNHGGKISVESEPGNGARFILFFEREFPTNPS